MSQGEIIDRVGSPASARTAAREANFALVGDLLLPSSLQYAPDSRAIIGDAAASTDLVIGNLEVPLTRIEEPADKFIVLRSEPDTCSLLEPLALDAVSLANNHAMDHGVAGIQETIRTLEKAGIGWAGTGFGLEEALAPCWLRAGGLRIALLSVATTVPPGFAAIPQRWGVAPINVQSRLRIENRLWENPGQPPRVDTLVDERDVARVLDAVSVARSQADVVMLALHWGVPLSGVPVAYQRPLAHSLMDGGVDVVIGHHPHVLQGIEFYRGRPILYSLGHYICHLGQIAGWVQEIQGLEREQFFLTATALLHYCDGSWSVRIAPEGIDPDGWPRPATASEGRRVAETLRVLSRPLGTEVQATDDALITAVPA